MSRRNIINKHLVWDAYDSATVTPQASEASVVDQVDVIKYVIKVDPTVVGTIEVEFTDDKREITQTWDVLDFKQALTINGATETDYMIIIEEHSCFKTRLTFTNNAGTGDITAWVTANNVGA